MSGENARYARRNRELIAQEVRQEIQREALKGSGPNWSSSRKLLASLQELAELGYDGTVDDLRHQSEPGKTALPLLSAVDFRGRRPQCERKHRALSPEEEDVKHHAIIALGKMKPKRAWFELKKLLTDTRGRFAKRLSKVLSQKSWWGFELSNSGCPASVARPRSEPLTFLRALGNQS